MMNKIEALLNKESDLYRQITAARNLIVSIKDNSAYLEAVNQFVDPSVCQSIIDVLYAHTRYLESELKPIDAKIYKIMEILE
jgi:hypothetical protein